MVDLLLPAFAAALLLALMLGPLGSFVVWRRMAYFGDTIAHSALLGVALSLVTEVPLQGAIFVIAVSVALLLTHLTRRQQLDADTLLGIMAHGGLALGISLIALSGAPAVELEAYLFGDIITINWSGVGRLALIAAVIFLLLARYWRQLLMTTIDPAIARAEGISPVAMQLLLTVLLAGVIAFTVKLTGVLLITALLLMPAATARQFARSPRDMVVSASLIGMVACAGGLLLSAKFAVPAGPAMVVATTVLFVLSSLLHRRA